MKKVFGLVLVILILISVTACAKKELKNEVPSEDMAKINERYVEVTKNFYNEYFKELDDFSDNFDERIDDVLSKYMTPVMAKEIKIRGMEKGCDAVIEAQDNFGMLDRLVVLPGAEEGYVIASFEENEYGDRSLFNIHFRKTGGQNLIDTYDSIVIRKGADGKEEELVEKTKWGNKENFTAEDEKEMNDIIKKHEDLAEQGYID